MAETQDGMQDATRVISGGGATSGVGSDMGSAGEATVVVSAAALPAGVPGASSVGDGLLLTGTRVAEFEITRLIGQGGFGAVYEAWDHTLERVVAIKEYFPTSLAVRQGEGAVVPLSEKHRETFDLGMRSFINEARLLAQFDHPSLLKVYRFWEERGTTYMVMPLYRGQTLREALAAQPAGVTQEWLLRVVDGVSQALGVIHEAQCYHRDIAPDNILLLEDTGAPVVLDFGAARRVITDKTQAITVILKPGYAPVEQYAEMPDMKQGPWTDVYALAAVMHVAVCGKSPPPSVARVISDGYVPLVSNELLLQRYDQQVLQAIDQGLAVRPEHRPQSMAQFRAALGLHDGAVAAAGAAMPLPSVAPMPSAAGRDKGAGGVLAATRRPVWWAGGAALVLVLAGLAWWLGRSAAPSAVVAGDTPAVPGVAPAGTAPLPSGEPLASAAKPASAAPAAPDPRTPLQSLQALANDAAAGFLVSAKPAASQVTIGKDKLSFEVQSQRAGFVYVYLLSSDGKLFLLFPNALDKRNKIAAGESVRLPRASWPMNSGGPAGINHFSVIVSEHERDYGDAGLQGDGIFPEFSLPVLASLESTRTTEATALRGKPLCPAGAPCDDVYGVTSFQIEEVK